MTESGSADKAKKPKAKKADGPGVAKTKGADVQPPTLEVDASKFGRRVLKVTDINKDGGTQSRAAPNEQAIRDYVKDLQNGDEFPAVDVYFDGETYWLADGFHRVWAHVRAKRPDIVCEVRKGDKRAAILFGVGANESDKARRTTADKRKAVELLLADSEWRDRSNTWIAEHCKVSDTFVGKVRDKVAPETTGAESAPRKGRDNKTRKYRKTGGKTAPPKEPRKPDDDQTNATTAVATTLPVTPADDKWECAKCFTRWPKSVLTCAECAEYEPSVPLSAEERAESRDAIERELARLDKRKAKAAEAKAGAEAEVAKELEERIARNPEGYAQVFETIKSMAESWPSLENYLVAINDAVTELKGIHDEAYEVCDDYDNDSASLADMSLVDLRAYVARAKAKASAEAAAE